MFAVGNSCSDCIRTSAEGFPEMTYEAIKDRCKSSVKFKDKFVKANQVRTGAKPRRFRRQQVHTSTTCGYTTEKWYMYLSLDEFFKAVGKTPNAVGVPVDRLLDEEGHPTSGVLLQEAGHPHAYRRVRVFCTVTDSGISETFSDPRNHLRANQGADFYPNFQGQQLKLRTPHLRRMTATMT